MDEEKALQGLSYSDALASELYNDYAEGDLIDDPALWEHYEALKTCVKDLPAGVRDEILSTAGRLATFQEERAFRAGLKLGLSRIKR